MVGDPGRTLPEPDSEESFAMSTATPAVRRMRLGPHSAGLLLTPAEFDRVASRKAGAMS